MEVEIILGGIGGQDIKMAAKSIAHAAMHRGHHALFFGLYEGVMRGGRSECTVITAPGPVTAPPLVRLLALPATRLGEEAGHPMSGSLVAVAALVGATGLLEACELVAGLEGCAFAQRVTAATPEQLERTRKALAGAFRCQMEGRGFSIVEILTMCPVGWFMEAPEAPERIEAEIARQLPLHRFKG